MTDSESSIDIVVVVGNPSPGGRTTRAGEAVAATLVAASSPSSEIDATEPGDGSPGSDGERWPFETIELADVAAHLFEWGNEQVGGLAARVAEADVVVMASPVSRATYTGLLKAFLDSYDSNGLAGCRAVPVMVGATPDHALAVDLHFRPLLVELGASVPTRGLYVLESQMDELGEVVAAWSVDAADLLLAGLR
jgi:FMN reductase